MTKIPTTRPPKSVEEVNATLHQFDGATLEWWRFSVTHLQCVWKVTGLPQGVGYIFMLATYYMNFPTVMHDVRLRIATIAETEELRLQLPQAHKSLPEYHYRIAECQEGLFSVWSKGFIVVWGEQEATRMLQQM